MKRKHGVQFSRPGVAEKPSRSMRRALCASVFAIVIVASPLSLSAASLRMWPTGVVVDDGIRLSDLCAMRGLASNQTKNLSDLVVTNAPPPGGSRVIHLDMVREALIAAGVNMAELTLGGAMECVVTRPVDRIAPTESPSQPVATPTLRHMPSELAPVTRNGADADSTLRRAVVRFFNKELDRYGGRADVMFDRGLDQILELNGSAFDFRIRRRPGAALGLIPLEVDVLAEGRVVQTVSIHANVKLIRQVTVARRGINQGATIRSSDVRLTPVSLVRLVDLGLSDLAQSIGQRAKRFISAGSVIQPDEIESVPLVTRGQIVMLTSVTGLVRVETSGTALADGRLGETISIGSSNRKRIRFDAVVVGPGRVLMGHDPQRWSDTRVAGIRNP